MHDPLAGPPFTPSVGSRWNFAVIGVGGYIAPKHLKAIADVGGTLVAACDLSDSVGVLDGFFPGARFFQSPPAFYAYLADVRRRTPNGRFFLTVCTPNHKHVSHTLDGVNAGWDVICEKPVTLSVGEAQGLRAMSEANGRTVWTVLQLRHNPELVALRERMLLKRERSNVTVEYVTPRGQWYDVGWKGDPDRSGGIAVNIGAHLFDILQWTFGQPLSKGVTVDYASRRAVGGSLKLERADVTWALSVDPQDLPGHPTFAEWAANPRAFAPRRTMTVDGEVVDLTGGAAATAGAGGFTDLHTEVYRSILTGRGAHLNTVILSMQLLDNVRRRADALEHATASPWGGE